MTTTTRPARRSILGDRPLGPALTGERMRLIQVSDHA